MALSSYLASCIYIPMAEAKPVHYNDTTYLLTYILALNPEQSQKNSFHPYVVNNYNTIIIQTKESFIHTVYSAIDSNPKLEMYYLV